jgi:hypothetical protein
MKFIHFPMCAAVWEATRNMKESLYDALGLSDFDGNLQYSDL